MSWITGVGPNWSLRPWLMWVFVVAIAVNDPKPGLHGAHLALLLALIAEVGCVYVLRWTQRSHPRWRVLPSLGSIVLAFALFALSSGGPALSFAFGMVLIGVWTLPIRQTAVLVSACVAGTVILGELGVLDSSGAIGLSIGFVGAAAGGYAIRERRAAREQAESARAAQQGESALAERARIAREIHDILAHSLSAQIVHLEGARLLLGRGDDTPAALERVEWAQKLARNGLEETKRALSALRGDTPPIGVALRNLAEEFEAASGRRCTVEVHGEELRLPAGTSLAVLRTAQEALTNVRRHAPGADVTVRLRSASDGCELRVVNSLTEDPCPAADGGGGGYGLVGMRERAELLGGGLAAAPEDGEFRVVLNVPLSAASPGEDERAAS